MGEITGGKIWVHSRENVIITTVFQKLNHSVLKWWSSPFPIISGAGVTLVIYRDDCIMLCKYCSSPTFNHPVEQAHFLVEEETKTQSPKLPYSIVMEPENKQKQISSLSSDLKTSYFPWPIYVSNSSQTLDSFKRLGAPRYGRNINLSFFMCSHC